MNLDLSQHLTASHGIAELQEHKCSAVVSQSAHYDEHMKDLMALPGYIKPSGLEPLRNSTYIKCSTNEVKECHQQLTNYGHIPPGIVPKQDSSMYSRNHAKDSHQDEECGTKTSVITRRKCRREQGDAGEEAHKRDHGEIDELPYWVALEYVVDGREEGRDDHDGDAEVIYAKKLHAEVVGVAAE